MVENKVDARWYWDGNTKVGKNIATFSTLPGDETFVTEKYGAVTGTCSGVCEYCWKCKKKKKNGEPGKLPPCYVAKSHRHTSVVESQSRNTLAIRTDVHAACAQLTKQALGRKNPDQVYRIHQAGEIPEGDLGWKVFDEYCNFSKAVGKTTYIYSKRHSVTIPGLLEGKVPENFTINVSIWHEQGIEEFLRVAHLPNVKAFVYMDKNTDPVNGWGFEEYLAHGILVTTTCKAYGKDGKMNHDITCSVCKKCFNRLASCKVIGCWDH